MTLCSMLLTRLLLSIVVAGCGVWAQDQKVNGDIQSIPVCVDGTGIGE